MFAFLIPVGSGTSDPLTNVTASEAFWRALPRDDPMAAQRAVCGVLAEPVVRGKPSMDRLRALLAFDQRARNLLDALLQGSVAGSPLSSLLGMQFSQSAFELCRSFGRAHSQFLRSMRDSKESAPWREYLTYMVLRVFQHRQTELLLRPFADERFTWFSWKEVHEAYRFAQSRELLHHEIPVNRSGSSSASETTLEREYIHVLLQGLINAGHFPPNDAFWISQSLPGWARAAVLRPPHVDGGEDRFVVDLDVEDGLARSNRESTASSLCLDMAPVLESILQAITVLRDDPSRPTEGSLGRQRQLKLLHKLSVLCASERPVIVRRGERQPIALAVEIIVGMSQILSKLSYEEKMAESEPRISAIGDDTTITALGGRAEVPLGANTVTQWPVGPEGVRTHLMMVDRSDSGCRLHGPTLGMDPIMPGALIAFREEAASSWTIAVVRRVKKRLAGKRVEIGAEYLGKNPRRVIVVDSDAEASSSGSPGSASPRFAALFLPESANHPVLPIKTLILPARGLAAEDRLAVRARTGGCRIQLKELLEEQADFVWSPFEIVER